MFLVGITLFLILIGLGFFAYGAFALSKYAFRLGTGPGLLTLLFPPYTLYFAVFKLEEDGKSWPTASYLFGIVVSVLLVVAFWPDLSALMTGDMERFKEEPAATAEAEPAADEAPAADKKEPAADEEPAEQAAGDEAAGDEAAGDKTAEGDDADKAEGDKAEADKAAADKAGADKSEGDKQAAAGQ